MHWQHPLWVPDTRRPLSGLPWLLGLWLLLICAPQVHGQSQPAGQPSGVFPSREAKNAFWPLGPTGVSSPTVPNTSPTSSGSLPTDSVEDVPSSGQDSSPPPQKASEGGTSSLQKASSAPTDNRSSPASKPQSDPSVAGPSSPSDAGSLPKIPNRLREGTKISQQKGIFKITGDRVIFSSLDEALPKWVVLENLNLQRVIQAIHGSPREEIWIVTGRVTEFQGTNYLLLERATRIDEADLENPPSPQE